MTDKKKMSSRAKPRNPIALNPLMKKSRVHSKSGKAERARVKQKLRKEAGEN